MRRRIFAPLAFAPAAALLLTGCGHGSGSGGSPAVGGGQPGASATAPADSAGSAAGGGAGATGAAAGGKTLNITVIPKGPTHDYWKAVHAGADDAAKKDNATVNWQPPANEQDSAGETSKVENAITSGADGIAVAPIDQGALVGAVQEANKKNIPVTIFDSAIGPGADYVSFVATDNTKGGVMAADQMGPALNGKGTVAFVPVTPGSASTQAREDGFVNEMKQKYPGITVKKLAYGNADRAQSTTVAENELTADPNLNGFYGPNESSAVGELNALQNRHLAGKVVLVGFDATQPMVDAVKGGQITALIVQDPYKIGYDAVDLLVQKIRGGNPPKRDDTGVHLVTKASLATPEIQKLMQSQKINP